MTTPHGGHVGTAHLNRPSMPPSASNDTAPGLAGRARRFEGLDRVMLGMSLRAPTDRSLARRAVEQLAATRQGLIEAVRYGPAAGEPELRRAVEALIAQTQEVLNHWSAVIDDQEWTGEQAAALHGELVQIVHLGARIRALITDLDPGSGRAGALASQQLAANHPSSRESTNRARAYTSPPVRPSSRSTRVMTGIAQIEPETWRTLGQVGGFFVAVCAAGAVCVMAFGHQHHPTGSPPAPALPSPTMTRSRAVSTAPPPRPGPPEPTPASPARGVMVSSLQIQLLGPSTQAPRVDAVLYIGTGTAGVFKLELTWSGTTGPRQIETYILSGRTAYSFTVQAASAPYCGGSVTATAVAEAAWASQTTSAGACPTQSATTSASTVAEAFSRAPGLEPTGAASLWSLAAGQGRIGERVEACLAVAERGALLVRRGDPVLGVALMESACDRLAESGTLFARVVVLESLARALEVAGRADQAVAAREKAADLIADGDSDDAARVQGVAA